MEAPLIVVAAVMALAVAYVAVPVAIEAYRHYRGTKIVTCPQTAHRAAIEVDAKDAALAAALGRPRADVTRCTNWPEREHCAQECVKQLHAAA
jgi:hypothetical protein